MEVNVTIIKEVTENIYTLRVSGVLDYSTMSPFDKEINSIESGTEKVIIDVEELEFIDSTGIGSIINLVHAAVEHNFDVEFAGMSDEIKELFETIGVFKIMESLLKEAP